MPCRIGENQPAALVNVQQRCPQRQHRVPSLVAVRHVDVEIELLWTGRIRPAGSLEVLCALERIDRPAIDVQGCERIARRPSWIRSVDLAAKQRAVELCKFDRVRVVDNDALNVCDHGVILADRLHAGITAAL